MTAPHHLSISRLMLAVGSALAVTLFMGLSVRTASAACQNQDCVWNGSCYECDGSVGQGCSESDCNSCTDKHCVQAPELVARGVDPAMLSGLCADSPDANAASSVESAIGLSQR